MSKFATDATQFILSHRYGMLCTQNSEEYPFGSVVPYVVTKDRAHLVIQIAQIAEHFRNIKNAPQSTLLVSDPFGTHEPMKYARATIFTTWKEALNETREEMRNEFIETVGNNIPAEIEPSFSYFYGSIEKIRWIGGFAQVGWVTGSESLASTIDPIARESYDITTHMNEDHADAVQEIASNLTDEKRAIGAKMIKACTDKIVIRLARGDDIDFPFQATCLTGDDIRRELIQALKTIRSARASS